MTEQRARPLLRPPFPGRQGDSSGPGQSAWAITNRDREDDVVIGESQGLGEGDEVFPQAFTDVTLFNNNSYRFKLKHQLKNFALKDIPSLYVQMYFHVVSLRCPRILVSSAVKKLITTVFLFSCGHTAQVARS